jgi:poly-gamma-glutamate system protein
LVHHRGVLVLAAFSILVMVGVESSKFIGNDPFFDPKMEAVRLTDRAFQVIRKERLRRGLEIDRDQDLNATGMIGPAYTVITTSLGALSSKRTTCNPFFSAVVTEMMIRAGVRPGDPVAVSFSGSFPALNIAVLAAVHALGLDPVIISSLGASMYGATDPDLTWLDMEGVLRKEGLFPYASKAASPGGIVDAEPGQRAEGLEVAMEVARSNGVPYLDEQGEKTLERDVETRWTIYERGLQGKRPALFINVGGLLTSLGGHGRGSPIPVGLHFRLPLSKDPRRGMIQKMSEAGVPVIHLLNIKKIARQYGLPIDPVPLPAVASGAVIKQARYYWPVVLTGWILVVLASIAVKKASR